MERATVHVELHWKTEKEKKKKKMYILGMYGQQGGTHPGRKIFMGIGKRHFLKINKQHKICSYI